MNFRLVFATTLTTTALLANAQFGDILKKPPISIPLPSLADLTKGEDPLTTTIKDVKHFGWPELDDLQPKDFVTLSQSDRNDKFTYSLNPGYYTVDLRSFCARGYTHAPTAGMGYVTGHWAGSKAAFLQDLLKRYNADDKVDQKDMQLLIWAVLARVQPKDMKGGARTALLQLMGDKGIELMAAGALDHFAQDASNKIFGQATRELRPLLEFDNKMRGLFYKANSTYDDFERLAILPEPKEQPKTDVPRGRWLIHPNGYLYRYFPSGYSKTTMQVVVPRKLSYTKDDKKRVTLVSGNDYEMRISYDDSAATFKCPSDENLLGYIVKQVTISTPAGTTTSSKPGWIFVGTPKKKQPVSTAKAMWLRIMRPAPLQDFGGWGERYERASDIHDRIETYEEYYNRVHGATTGAEPSDDLFNGGHIRDLIDSLFGGEDDRLGQIADTHSRLMEHLGHATGLINTLGEGTEMDPGSGIMLPGNPGSQRLIGSSHTW